MVSPHSHSFYVPSLRFYPTNRPGSDKYFVARSEEEALRKMHVIYPVYSNVLAVDVQKNALIDNLVPAVTSFSQKCCSIDKSRFRGACRRQAVGIKFRIRVICKSL